MTNEARLDRMRRAMQREGLDALVLQLPENVLLLSGFWPMIGATVFVFPVEGTPHCIIPECYEREASSSLWTTQTSYYRYGLLGAPAPASATLGILSGLAQGKSWTRIGFEGSFEVVAPSWNTAELLVPAAQTRELLCTAFDGCKLVDASALLQSQRRTKTPYEIAKLRTASEVSSIGLESFDRLVEVGVSGVELAAAIERDVMAVGTGRGGAFRVRAFAQVAVGSEETAVGYRPNEVSTTRRLKSGDIALLELGVVVDGFWADRTRVRAAGQPTDEQVKIFNVVKAAQEAAVKEIGPGVRAAQVDEAARSVVRDAGYAESFPHVTGHGLGFRYHESSPTLSPDSSETLEEGVLTSVEPGIYRMPYGGFRIEDDVLVTKGGAEVLAPFPKNLV
jgi:Xaa-Pro aminopeptidase